MDKVGAINSEVDNTSEIMQQNIDKIMDQNQNLRLTQDHAAYLEQNAKTLEYKTRSLKRDLCKNRAEIISIITILFLLAIFITTIIYTSKVKS